MVTKTGGGTDVIAHQAIPLKLSYFFLLVRAERRGEFSLVGDFVVSISSFFTFVFVSIFGVDCETPGPKLIERF